MSVFSYPRTIHFADTDAAGVVFFARYLSIAHEAYEEALSAHGVPLAQFFSDTGLVIPVAKSEAAYLRPLVTGESIEVEVIPTSLSSHSFRVDFTVWKPGPPKKRAAVISTEHVCIDADTRAKIPLPPAIAAWVTG